jgi:hypothetical protein
MPKSETGRAGRAISVQVKLGHPVTLSVSLFDRNRVAYATSKELQGGVWQAVRISFDEIRPNPYLQLSGARRGAPIDLSDVEGVAFAPHDQTAGSLMISEVVVLR